MLTDTFVTYTGINGVENNFRHKIKLLKYHKDKIYIYIDIDTNLSI